VPGVDGFLINVGSGREVRIADLFELISQRVGGRRALEVDRARTRPDASEVERLVADATLARRVLQWEPEVTLEAGLDRTIAWTRANLEHFKVGDYHV
jgi:dTDP-glucose 4,6-dehydratase